MGCKFLRILQIGWFSQTMGVVTSCKKVSCALELRSIEDKKIETVKISSKGLRGDSTKICTTKISRYTIFNFHTVLFALED